MFASKTIVAHLLRGVIAAGLIAWALAHQSSDSAFALVAVVLAMIAMRGCPLCWTVGLFETVGKSFSGRRTETRSSHCTSCSW